MPVKLKSKDKDDEGMVVLSNKKKLQKRIKEINQEREKKGKVPKYTDLTFQKCYGDKTIAYVNHFTTGRIGPVEGNGPDAENIAAGELLERIYERETRVLGFLNFGN